MYYCQCPRHIVKMGPILVGSIPGTYTGVGYIGRAKILGANLTYGS